jgi:uncharacterized protein YdeI (YjbR/CyaY-like superfamily)
MDPVYFKSAAAFREWLEANHRSKDELVVGFYKTGSGKLNMTWSESVDEALCFGWIDGIRRSVDDDSYSIRFTPRRPSSVWSRININKVEELKLRGLMKPAGLEAYSKRRDDASAIYSFENDPMNLDKELEDSFIANEKAWTYFSRQAPSYRKAVIRWVMSAKQDKTRNARLEKLISRSQEEKKVY